MAADNHTDAELRRAWRECALLNTSFEQAMANKALAIAIRLTADSHRRRQLRHAAERQRFDHKRAQANDQSEP